MSNQSLMAPFGLMHQLWQMPDDAHAGFLRRTIEDIGYADELGYDSVWVAEHHYHRDLPFFSRVPDGDMLLARLVPETSRIRLATGIKILPLDTPERVAERVFFLDQMSGGRAGCAVGQGSPDEMGVLTLTREERRANFQEKFEQLAAILDSHITRDGLKLLPEADVSASSVLWAGVRDAVSLQLAARCGANMIAGEAEVGRSQARFIDEYRKAGGTGEIRGARLVCIGDTAAEARATAVESAKLLFNQERENIYHRQAVEAGDMSGAPVESDDDLLGRLEFAAGDPETVTRELASYIETTGITALNILVHAPGVPQDSARRSLELFMAEVAPKLQPMLVREPAAVA